MPTETSSSRQGSTSRWPSSSATRCSEVGLSRRTLAFLTLLASLAAGCGGSQVARPAASHPATPQATIDHTPLAAATSPTPSIRFPSSFPRGAYGEDTSADRYDHIAAAGFNVVMTSPFKVNLDALQAHGLRGVVWLGQGYNSYCHWENDDAWIRSHVSAIAGHPAIAAYYLGDEPSYALCPEAPARYAARTALVHSLDPLHATFTVLQVSDQGHRYDYGRWAASVDILGLDVYPCNLTTAACDFGKIDAAVAAAAQARLPRYWAVIQDFKDSFYRLPTGDEIAREFEHWDRSAMSGYLVFSWNFRGYSLDSVPANVQELKRLNANHGA